MQPDSEVWRTCTVTCSLGVYRCLPLLQIRSYSHADLGALLSGLRGKMLALELMSPVCAKVLGDSSKKVPFLQVLNLGAAGNQNYNYKSCPP